jgi:hypothetical protein
VPPLQVWPSTLQPPEPVDLRTVHVPAVAPEAIVQIPLQQAVPA